MHDVEDLLEAGRGVLAIRAFPAEERARIRQELLRRGFGRVRSGWYAKPGADPAAVAAVAAGGALSCIQALNFPGVWQPHGQSGLHVRFRRPTPHPHHVVDHRLHGTPRSVLQAVDPPEIALSCAVKCLAPADAVAVCDSLLREHILEPHDVLDALNLARSFGARIRPMIDPSAESGIESHLRVLLRSLQVSFRTQVLIRDVGRVDTLIGDRLVVEADGLEYHSAEHAKQDRQRDMILHQLGFSVLRFSYWQILSQPDEVRATIQRAIHAREHRWRRRNCHWQRFGQTDPILGVYRSVAAQRWLAVQ